MLTYNNRELVQLLIYMLEQLCCPFVIHSLLGQDSRNCLIFSRSSVVSWGSSPVILFHMAALALLESSSTTCMRSSANEKKIGATWTIKILSCDQSFFPQSKQQIYKTSFPISPKHIWHYLTKKERYLAYSWCPVAKLLPYTKKLCVDKIFQNKALKGIIS